MKKLFRAGFVTAAMALLLHGQSAAPSAKTSAAQRELLDKFCVACHNTKLKSGTLSLESPSGLGGTISNWQGGDVIDFVSTTVTGASITGSTLTANGGQFMA